jgi:peptidoglycan-N-acetylglucosamine deacetylase
VKLAWAVGTISLFVTVLLIAALMVEDRAPVSIDPVAHNTITTREKEGKLRTHHPQAESPPDRRPEPVGLKGPDERSLSIGFYVNWDDNSYPALKRALPHLDWLIPGWLNLEGPTMDLKTNIEDRALKYVHATKPNILILPMIQNAVEGQWDGARLARLLANPTARAARIKEIVGFLATNKFQGLTIDFEEVPAAAQKNLQLFLTEMATAFAPHRYIIVLAVPFDDDSWPYATYAKIADFLLLMGYDQHEEEGAAGSIAGQRWFEETLNKRMKDLDPDHTIIAVGGYGYDWVRGKKTEDLSFEEAILSARDSEADIVFDSKSANPHFSFIEDDGKHHDVWFLDGVTAFNEIHAADTYRPAGYALWRLGGEDPSIWSVLGRPYGTPAPEALRVIGKTQDSDFEGEGEMLRVAEGGRTFKVDNRTGEIVDQVYKVPHLPANNHFVYTSAGVEPARLGNQIDTGSFPLYRRAEVLGAPEGDEEHPEGLSYVPVEVASLMTDVSVSYNDSLSRPEQRSLSYLFYDMHRPLALSFRENAGSQGLAAAQRFSGHAVRSLHAEAATSSPRQLAESTR